MTPSSGSTVLDIDEGTDAEIRRRRRRYGLTTAALSLLMALGVVDALGWIDTYGVDDDVVSAEGGGYELRVRYPSVSRPALASPFEIEVTRPEGFDVPVEIAVDRAYLEMWDENGLVPAPSTERSTGRWVDLGVRATRRDHADDLVRRPDRARRAVRAPGRRRCARR